MKSYEETAKKVLYMRDNILRKRAEKRKKVMTFCTPAAVLCLALFIGIGISHGAGSEKEPQTISGSSLNEGQRPENEMVIEGGEGEKLIPDTYCLDSEKFTSWNSDGPLPPSSTSELIVAVTSSRDGLVTSPSEGDKGQMDICRGFIYVNRIVGEATAAKRTYDKMNYFSEQVSADEAEEYYGIRMDKIMSALPDEMKYFPLEHTFIKKIDGAVADDSAHFYIDCEGGGSITISCGKAIPPYDCLYVLSKETVSEVITEDGETVSLLMGYKDLDEKRNICGLFFADFKLDGVYYRVECKNIDAFDIILLLLKAVIS